MKLSIAFRTIVTAVALLPAQGIPDYLSSAALSAGKEEDNGNSNKHLDDAAAHLHRALTSPHYDTYPLRETGRKPKFFDKSICGTLQGQEKGHCTACFSKAEANYRKASKDCDSNDDICLENAMTEQGRGKMECSRYLLLQLNPWEAPGPSDQRGPCPFINTLANHGVVNRNGQDIDLIDMAVRLEAVYNVDFDFLNGGPVQLAIDCDQTTTDGDGIIRLDLEALFKPECEEHEASFVRADKFFGVAESKLVDVVLLDTLVYGSNPGSDVLTKDDVTMFQVGRIQDSAENTPDFDFRPAFDIDNMGAQAVFLFLLGSDPENSLETVNKDVLHSFLLHERLPDNFVPGSLRDTPFNFLDSNDFSSARFERSRENVISAVEAVIGELP